MTMDAAITRMIETSSVEVSLRGQPLRLMAGGGVYHPETSTLFVADLHLGKDATFRKSGLAVPVGSARATLQRVSGLIERSKARQLFLLGDLFHARSSLSQDVIDAWFDFRQQHDSVDMTLVRGNHDAGIHHLPESWRLPMTEEGYRHGELVLLHHPSEVFDDESPLALAGHIHPSYRLMSSSDNLGRVPCFWYRKGCMVMPAIGKFTGTYNVKHRGSERLWVTLNDEVVEIP